MPKFFNRVDFETMKVLRKRGSSINDVVKAVGRNRRQPRGERVRVLRETLSGTI